MEIIDIRHMKNLRDKGEITKDKYYHEIMESVKVYLQAKMRLEIISVAGNGEFGDVIAKMHKSTEELSINVVSNEIAERKLIEDWPKQGIITNWPKLKHQNILNLLHTEYLPQLEVHLLFTPNQPSCLECYLEDEDFINDPGALQQVEKWIREILDALEYLHSKNYCHLSLMINRILISANSRALLSHFYCLDSVDAPSNKYDVQHEYKPPETCPALCGSPKMAVDGVSFDIWSFGVFALQIFTRSYIEESIPTVYTNWRDEIYPVLYKILQKNTFMEYLKEAFPACTIENEALEAMINMITTCLRILPEDRPSASLLKCHKYFKHGGYLSTDEDAWIREGGGNTMQIIIYSCLENIQQIERIPQPFPPDVMTITKKSLSLIEGSSDSQISVTKSENQMNELDENEEDEVIQPAEISSMSEEKVNPLKSNENECSVEQINPLGSNENEQNAEYISSSRTNESTDNSTSTEEVNLPKNDNKSLLAVNLGLTLEDLDSDYIRDFLRRSKPTFYTIVHSEDEMENKTPGKFSRWISYEKIYLNKPVLESQPLNNTVDQSLVLSDLEDDSEQSTELHLKSDSHDIYQTEDSNVQITAEDIDSQNDKNIASSQNFDETCDAETDQVHSKVTTSKKKRKNPVRRFFGRIRKCCLAPFVCCCRRKTNANN